jgi:hypothetical protein
MESETRSSVAMLAIALLLIVGPLHGQQAPAAAQAGPVLSVDDAIAMLEAKIAEGVIVLRIRKSAQPYDLSPQQMVALKKAGASDALLTFMMDPSQPYTPSLSALPAAAAAAAPAPAPVAAPVGAAAPSPATPSASLEIGVYLKKSGEWSEIRPEIVNWKTGGTIKNLATVGVVKKDLNGNVDGPTSRTSVKTPVEVLLVTAEGVAPEEYQLLRLRVNKNYREFRSVTGGILNQRSGAMRDLIPFEAKKISSRNFSLIVPASLGAGEYGILPPGAGGSSTTAAVSSQYGKLYTFKVVD